MKMKILKYLFISAVLAISMTSANAAHPASSDRFVSIDSSFLINEVDPANLFKDR